LRACSISSGDNVSSGSATPGGGGSIFADSATSSPRSSDVLSPESFREDFLSDGALSNGFPDFFVGLSLVFGALASDGLVVDDLFSDDLASDDLAFVDFVAAVVLLDCPFGFVLTARFLADDAGLPMT
jgi:hypothetical protein